MGSCTRISSAAILVASLLLSATATGARAQSDADVQRVLEESGASSDLKRFYALRSNRPAWFASGRPNAVYEGLGRVIGDLRSLGLDPARFALPSGRPPANLEIEASRTALRLADALSRGRVDPADVYFGQAMRAAAGDLPERLHLAISTRSVESFFRSLEPEHPLYARLKPALTRYVEIQEAGGWPQLAAAEALYPGDSSNAVATLRRRLAAEGYLPTSMRAAVQVFDAELERAVQSYQEDRGLDVDGIVGPQTFADLNVPVERRIAQIELNLERWRALPREYGRRYAHINVAGFRIDVVEHGQPVMRMKVIVGKPSTRTPLFTTSITEVILAPYWYVPRSIEVNEIMPNVRRDPGYLARHDMIRLGTGVLRQEPGPSNPLGRVKFTIPNAFGVGLHDTPERHLFNRSTCAFSHGCMRLEHPEDLALYLLRDKEWTSSGLNETIEQWRSTRVPVSDPLPLHVRYWTAWVDEDGSVQFRRDVYGYDARLEYALTQR